MLIFTTSSALLFSFKKNFRHNPSQIQVDFTTCDLKSTNLGWYIEQIGVGKAETRKDIQ